tara:strand:+ start:7562 stop:7804 length:243 start_codon:yes stop_codon:yes gene_type:complete
MLTTDLLITDLEVLGKLEPQARLELAACCLRGSAKRLSAALARLSYWGPSHLTVHHPIKCLVERENKSPRLFDPYSIATS